MEEAFRLLRCFVGRSQLGALMEMVHGEEAAYYRDLIRTMVNRVATMPLYLTQDGKGMAAVAHLHYFRGTMHCYLTERDDCALTAPQRQAFGWWNVGGGDFGMVDVPDLLAHGFELDLHFKPTTLHALCPDFAPPAGGS